MPVYTTTQPTDLTAPPPHGEAGVVTAGEEAALAAVDDCAPLPIAEATVSIADPSTTSAAGGGPIGFSFGQAIQMPHIEPTPAPPGSGAPYAAGAALDPYAAALDA